MSILNNDVELFEALLKGEKIERIRYVGSGDFIHIVDNSLVDADGNPANIYRLNSADLYQIVKKD